MSAKTSKDYHASDRGMIHPNDEKQGLELRFIESQLDLNCSIAPIFNCRYTL